MTNEQIREIFMAHGFTVKEGQTDLKPYVYAAARALLSVGKPAAPAQSAQSVTWRDAIKSYPSPDMTLAPQPSPTAVVLDDERAAFETWCETYAGLGQRDFHRTVSGAYRSCYVDDMWDGWKARAGLNSSTGNQEVDRD